MRERHSASKVEIVGLKVSHVGQGVPTVNGEFAPCKGE
jgi:hypothetical protein